MCPMLALVLGTCFMPAHRLYWERCAVGLTVPISFDKQSTIFLVQQNCNLSFPTWTPAIRRTHLPFVSVATLIMRSDASLGCVGKLQGWNLMWRSCCNENALPHQIERQRNYISISCAQKSCGHVQSIVSSIIFHQPFLRAFKICPRVELTGLQLICSKIHQFEVYSQRQFFHPWMIFDSECGCHHALGPWKHSMLDAILLLVSVSLFTGKKMLNFEDCFWIFWEISIVFLRCPCWRGCCRPVVQCGGAWTLTSVSHWYSDNVVCQIGRCIEESLAFPIYLTGRVNQFFEVPEDLKWFNKGPPEGRHAFVSGSGMVHQLLTADELRPVEPLRYPEWPPA